MFGLSFLNKKKQAFTLAEVLVTLAIIGVVAAMTVPTLMQNYQRKAYVAQLQKVYNEASQAASQYMTDRNAVNLKEAGLNSGTAAQNLIRNYFKVVSTCDNSLSPCFADAYTTLDSNSYSLSGQVSTSFVLASGSSIRPLYSYDSKNQKLVNLFVDTNGKQGPNILGRDAFYMALYSDGTIDTYNANATSIPLTEDQRNSAGTEWGPFGKILNANWEMTY